MPPDADDAGQPTIPTSGGTRPRRVLRVITRLVVSGPATHVVLADRGLAERGWQTLLVHGTVQPDEAEIDIDAAGIAHERVPSLMRPVRPAADARTFAALVGIIRRYRPDVIHTHQSKAGLLTRAAAMASSRAVRVHTFHGTVFDGYFSPRVSAAIIRAETFLAGHTDRLVALSDGLRDDLVARGIAPASRFTVIPLGVNLERFAAADRLESRRERGIPEHELAIVALGRFAPIKRLDRAIRVFATVHERRPETVLHLVGDGAIRSELQPLAASLGIADAVRFEGWSSDAAGWLAAADVVLQASDNEGTPLTLVEAGAAGRAVVATDVGGVRSVVIDGENGLLVPAGDEAALTDALARVTADGTLRAALGDGGRRLADRFGAGRLTDDLDALYRDLLRERRGRSEVVASATSAR
jgi:glycosyltransferase involved in cell wall biosynthesis